MGHTQNEKQLYFSRNNKSRSSAFRNFLFYQSIICFGWVMNLFLFCVMFFIKKGSFPAKTAESKGIDVIFHKKKGKKMLIKGKIFGNLGKNVRDLKIFWKRAGDCVRLFSSKHSSWWRRPEDTSWSYVFKVSSRRFEDVFKTFLRRIIKLNCSCWHVFKICSRYIQNVSETYFKDAYL